MTGTGVSGSGGVKAGRVKGVMIEKGGHLMPMEQVGEVADHCAEWMEKEMQRWRKDEKVLDEMWDEVKGREKFTLSERYLRELRGDRIKGEIEKEAKEEKAERKSKL